MVIRKKGETQDGKQKIEGGCRRLSQEKGDQKLLLKLAGHSRAVGEEGG